jgi:NADPH-dependent 2,4-dienoyl-CoA reductase/sulfur reductase-like enzyme
MPRSATCRRELLPADVVIVGITPSAGPLLEAGAKVANGVEINEYCRTTLQGVYAIGDCALRSSTFAEGRWIRLESLQNATDMAATGARAITGSLSPTGRCRGSGPINTTCGCRWWGSPRVTIWRLWGAM